MSTSSIPTIPDPPGYAALILNRNGVILAVNAKWRAYGILSGLSRSFIWQGVDYFDLMRELVLPSAQLSMLQSGLNSIYNGARLTFSSRFTKPPFLKGSKTFLIEAVPQFAESRYEISSLLLFHRYMPAARLRPGVLPTPLPFGYPARYLPICASCKSIRVGQTWVPIEQYLKKQLHTELTHDICPNCLHTLYPQYARALRVCAE
ncbi:hypothetical protein KIH86_23230 [Paenibacillus sp. HN-1]|uniref:hypothetical protein n=1 Tax=Paenibacillus TaxID=44249 RepID=UPI001CA9FF30|nr:MULTISPECIES: hypothetical protein [Paenibacillus]MBY9081068.1 hypothetical protein [Paenibacillus sp. CGMCC 1.18879]MBY9087105.1 hypothetical protein [Paenibacillus sinensis]